MRRKESRCSSFSQAVPGPPPRGRCRRHTKPSAGCSLRPCAAFGRARFQRAASGIPAGCEAKAADNASDRALRRASSPFGTDAERGTLEACAPIFPRASLSASGYLSAIRLAMNSATVGDEVSRPHFIKCHWRQSCTPRAPRRPRRGRRRRWVRRHTNSSAGDSRRPRRPRPPRAPGRVGIPPAVARVSRGTRRTSACERIPLDVRMCSAGRETRQAARPPYPDACRPASATSPPAGAR